MKFEFDPEKSKTNKDKHGVTLGQATQIWEEAYLDIAARTVDEPRFMVIGTIRGQLHACIYTMRGESIRLISCRRAGPKEVQLYNGHFKKAKADS